MVALHTVRDIDLEIARRHLRDFVKYMWPVLEPGRPLVWGWPFDAICDHLEAISQGYIKNLIINIPPRFLKSTLVSVMWPCWEWLEDPSLRYLTASYNIRLAERDAVKSRRLITSNQYRALNVDEHGRQRFELTSDQNTKGWYENDRTGYRICTSPDSAATGHGGDRIPIDDPHNVREARSIEQLKKDCDWSDQAMETRKNDPLTVPRVVMMQRLHDLDLSGHCLRLGWEILCLPLEFERAHPTPSRTSLGFVDPRTKEGQLLLPSRITPELVEKLKRTLGPIAYAAQMQQRPVTIGGNVIPVDRFGRWSTMPDLGKCQVIGSWDLKFKGNRSGVAAAGEELGNSYVVAQILAKPWGGKQIYLLDQLRAKWDIVGCIEQFRYLRARWPQARKHIVENKANGAALEAILKNQGIELVDPCGDKVQRAIACVPFIHRGDFLIPEDEEAYPWVPEYIGELKLFPNASNDDQVDATTQGLLELGVDDGVEVALESLDSLIAGLTGFAA